MSNVEFLEEKARDGIFVNWTADTPRGWKRALYLLKRLIPHEERDFDPSTKRWFISDRARPKFTQVKQLLENESDEQLIAKVDETINKTALADSLPHRIPSHNMKLRSAFVVETLLGHRDAPVELCISRGHFAAYCEEKDVWFYEDGRWSSYSPTELDRKVAEDAHDRIDKAASMIPRIYEHLDTTSELSYKSRLRMKLLKKYDYQCYVCEEFPGNTQRLHMHRIIPGRLGGEYTEENVVIVCVSCHRSVEGLSRDELEEYKQQHT